MKTKLLLSAMMLSMSLSLFAQSGTCGTNLTWTLSGGTLTIFGTGAMTDYTYSGGKPNTPWYPYRESIKTVKIGSSITSIGEYAFYDCSSLTSLTCEAINPPKLAYDGVGVFYGVDKSIPLYVPPQSIDLYKAADQWKDFTNILPLTAVGGGATGGIGLFSVSATQQVTFSRGNLQFNAVAGTHLCADGTTKQGTWRFAEHQWDMVGMGYGQTNTDNDCYIGGTVANSDNRQIGSNYSGWIDLFGWGTGNAPTRSSMNYRDDYQTFVDWGTNAISNGGNQANMWRTLTYDEWDYLFNTRANASSKYGVGMVNGVTGVVVLPDEFTLPSGLTFNAGMASSNGYQYYKTKNNYSAAEWAKMEACGALFLPAAGSRHCSNVYDVGSYGYYWSSTPYGTDGAYGRSFYSYNTSWNYNRRSYGHSVRLVRAAQNEQEPVYSLSVSVEGGGTVTGAGEYKNGTTATLTATAASGYTFSQWSDGKTDNPRIIKMERDLFLTAVFTAVGGGATGGIGLFSVSATQQVTFSRGNLQFNAAAGTHQCADGTTKQGTWRFAEHQWDIVGMGYGQTNTSDYCYIGGTVANSDNRQIGSSYSGWIDLFGWGTGNAPTKNNTSNSDYSTFVDWGTNPISNGGNQANMWRTLTNDEWNYLFSGRANASSKYGVGMVNGINGMIVLPDEFTLPSGLTFNAGMASSGGYQYYQTKNNYSAAEWARMEACGALFLPAAGYRSGSSVRNVGYGGHYWSSTPYGTDGAYDWYFRSYSTNRSNSNRRNGHSVRLVRAAQGEQEPVYSLSVSVEGEGMVTGAGEYKNGTPATLTATAASGYTFSQWSDGNTDNPCTITMTQNLTLTAVFTAVGGGSTGGISLFSVSATQKVTFSPGNLQFNAASGTHRCADGTTKQGTWRFAPNQWDYVGEANKNVSSSYSGWIDLFGWGTSGWNSGANAYQPYSTSTSYSDYYPGGSSSNNLTGNYANADWGVYNQIGDDAPGSWRTLTKDEWNYLFRRRANASSKYGAAKVNGVSGVVVLPDNWIWPVGCGFTAGMTIASNSYDWSYVATTNIYSASQWQLMESAGAVFLPAAACYRYGTTVYGAGSYGHYWSSTRDDTSNAYHLYFNSYGLDPQYCLPSSYGQSVRLVRVAQNEQEPVYGLIVSVEGEGTVTGAGEYKSGTTATLTATAASGYTFSQWSDGNTDNPRTITMTQNLTLTAVFVKNTFLVSFVNYDGSNLQSGLVEYGIVPQYNGTEPTKPADAQYTYTFAGWDKEVVAVTANATYTATYSRTVNQYTVTFKNEDGSILDSRLWNYGATPICTDPTKPSDAQYTYTFAGWDKEVVAVTGDATYTAVFESVVQCGTIETTDGITVWEDQLPYTWEGISFTTAGTETKTLQASDGCDSIVTFTLHVLYRNITLQENESSDYYTQFANDYNGRTVNTATLNRQFTQGKWATLCLPFNVNKAMMMSLGLYNRVFAFRYAQQLDDETIQVFFVPAQSIEAGKGYIVNPNSKLAAKTSFVFPNVTINTDSDSGDITALTGYNDGTGRGNLYLVGTLRTGILQGTTAGNTYLGLKDNQLYYPNTTSGTSMRAYRAVFRSDIPVNASRVRIIADGEPVSELQVVGTAPTDGSDKSAPSYTPARKYIDNGILYIERNGITYTAQGQRID